MTAAPQWHDVDFDDVPTPDTDLARLGNDYEAEAALRARMHRRDGLRSDAAKAEVYAIVANLILEQGNTRRQVAEAAISAMNAGRDLVIVGAWHTVVEQLSLEPRRVARRRATSSPGSAATTTHRTWSPPRHRWMIWPGRSANTCDHTWSRPISASNTTPQAE